MGRFPSGQRGQTVNLLQIASVVRIHLRPLSFVRLLYSLRVELINAGVAELADAQDLKSCRSNTVPVRFRSPALVKSERNIGKSMFLFFYFSFAKYLSNETFEAFIISNKIYASLSVQESSISSIFSFILCLLFLGKS